MKKLIAIVLTIILLFSFMPSVFANDNASKYSIVMAINEEVIIVNGVQSMITPPMLVLDKTYVDLYDVAPFIGINVEWVEDYIGYFKVSSNEKVIDFTLISKWDEIRTQTHKFFVKDSKIYVSLRELCDLAGHNIIYKDGIIAIGNEHEPSKKIYGDIAMYDFDDYVYMTYPCEAAYIVNPYQKYSYETMLDDANKLEAMYPELVKTSSIGKSVEERELLLIEFGRGKNKIFVCGAHHGREYISTSYLMHTIDRYAYAYRNNSTWGKYNPREILDNVTYCIVPMVNPDGVNLVQNGLYATKNPDEVATMKIYEGSQYGYLAWKANIRGVDLNWNYDKDWSSEKTKNPRGSSGFTGDRPETEPETIAISRYVDNIPFDAFMSFHTQGEIFYFAEDMNNPTYVNEVIKRDTGFDEIRDYGTGNGGSFFDYVYRNFHKPTITVELCPYIGNYPYPDSDFDTVWNPTKNVLLIVGNEIIYHKSK